MKAEIQNLIELDLTTGGHQTFDYVVDTLKVRGGATEDIFTLAEFDIVMVDLGVRPGNEKTPTDIFRLSLMKLNNSGSENKDLRIWRLDERGHMKGLSYGILDYPTPNGNRTMLISNPLQYFESEDLPISPDQLADNLDQALANLNNFNWRVIVGKTEATPVGEI